MLQVSKMYCRLSRENWFDPNFGNSYLSTYLSQERPWKLNLKLWTLLFHTCQGTTLSETESTHLQYSSQNVWLPCFKGWLSVFRWYSWLVEAGTRYVVPATSENSKYMIHQAQVWPRNVRREWQRSEETRSANNPCGKRRDWPSYLCESLRKVKCLKTEKSKRKGNHKYRYQFSEGASAASIWDHWSSPWNK